MKSIIVLMMMVGYLQATVTCITTDNGYMECVDDEGGEPVEVYVPDMEE